MLPASPDQKQRGRAARPTEGASRHGQKASPAESPTCLSAVSLACETPVRSEASRNADAVSIAGRLSQFHKAIPNRPV